MKANEAPEKLYLFENPVSGTPDDRWLSKRSGDTDIEYTRTDAFIEKVGSFLNKKDDRDSYTIGYIKRHLEEIIKEIGL